MRCRSASAIKKSPAKLRLCGLTKCIRRSGRPGPLARLAAPLFATISRRLSSSIAAGELALRVCSAALASRHVRRARAARSGWRLGQRARERSAGLGAGRRAPPRAARGLGSSCASSNAHADDVVRDVQRAVAGDPRRPRVPRDRVAHRRRPARDDLRRSASRAEARELAPDLVADPLRLHLSAPGTTSTSWRRLDRQRRALGRGDDRLAMPREPLGEHAAAALVELREHVVEQQERRRGPALGEQLRLGEEQREHREPLLALRAEAAAGRGRPPRSRRRPGAGRGRSSRARDPRRAAPRAPSPSAARPRRRASRPAGRARPRARRTAGASAAIASRRAATSARPSAATCSVHGASASRDESPERTRRERRVALRERRRVVRGQRRRAPGCSRAERPVEVRAPGRRAALDDGQPVGREDERRELRAQLLGGAQRAPFSSPASLAGPQRHLDRRAACRPRSPVERRPAPPRAEADELRVRRASAARSPACRRAATRAGSSCRRRSAPTTSTIPGESSSSSEAYER